MTGGGDHSNKAGSCCSRANFSHTYIRPSCIAAVHAFFLTPLSKDLGFGYPSGYQRVEIVGILGVSQGCFKQNTTTRPDTPIRECLESQAGARE